MEHELRAIEERYEHLAAELADPAVLGDRKKYEKTSRAYAELEPVVEASKTYRRLKDELGQAREVLDESAGEPELVEMAKEEVGRLDGEVAEWEDKLKVLLLPKDENDDKSVILEIRAGTGGDEATLFAAELLRAYLRYVEGRGWKAKIVHSSESAVGGLKEAIVDVDGKGAYSRLKHESGVHRVQRVPQTEAQGRIHTSAASVAVLPEVEEVDIQIEERELRVDYTCSSGPGGQSVNTTYSAVRLTHLPTGMIVQCQDEKSQHANKASAMKVMRARLQELAEREQHDSIAADRKSMVGSGDRSEKIRTYNFPQGRITDHRLPLTIHRINEVMGGDLDHILEPVIAHFQAVRLKEGSEAAS